MSLHDEITKAIGAHGLWKSRLMSAIETGKSEFTPEQVCLDNKCDFGSWLYGAHMPPEAKKMPDYEICRELHAKFHKIAGNILKLALSGKKAEAQAALNTGGEYAEVSGNLTKAMMKWKASVSV